MFNPVQFAGLAVEQTPLQARTLLGFMALVRLFVANEEVREVRKGAAVLMLLPVRTDNFF